MLFLSLAPRRGRVVWSRAVTRTRARRAARAILLIDLLGDTGHAAASGPSLQAPY